MLRKDLKPGDVFRYVKDPITHIHFVPPMDNPPPGAVPSKADSSFNWEHCWNSEVEVIPKDKPNIVSPTHYVGKQIEAIDVIEDWGLNFRLANVVKYIARHGKKPGADALDDLKKAKAYLGREIAALEGRKAWE